jgi:hypothetical protein
MGIDIDNVSKNFDFKDLFISHVPTEVHIKAA